MFNQERGGSKAKRRLSNLEVSDFIIKNQIINLQELFAKADTRKQKGECDLATYIFSRSQKTLVELITKSFLLITASAALEQEKISRMEKVCHAAISDCIDGCGGNWLECAIDVLTLNGIHPCVFALYVRELLTLG